MSALLFSCGTLRRAEVQRAVFGRPLLGRYDEVAGYALEEVVITDPHVIAASGSDRRPVLVPSEGAAGVPGTVFVVTDADLAAADAHEVGDCKRVLVPLRSGDRAWAYVLDRA